MGQKEERSSRCEKNRPFQWYPSIRMLYKFCEFTTFWTVQNILISRRILKIVVRLIVFIDKKSYCSIKNSWISKTHFNANCTYREKKINELKFRKITRGCSCILAIIQTNNLQRSLERKSRKIKDIRKLVSPNRGSGTITGITGRPGINIRSFGCREKPGASRNFLRRKKILKSCIAVLNRRIVKKEIARLALEDD